MASLVKGSNVNTDRNQEATLFVGNLDDKVSEAVLWELMLQAGPVVSVFMPRDRVTSMHQSFGFVEFESESDADYAVKIMTMVKLYGKPLRINKASADKQTNIDIGANLFIGNLSPEVDEQTLHDTFSAFGLLIQMPLVVRDNDTGVSKGVAFVHYDTFEASDAAIAAMHGQFLANRCITVQYAMKRDGKGERHGSQAERLLAQQMRKQGTVHEALIQGAQALKMQLQNRAALQQGQGNVVLPTATNAVPGAASAFYPGYVPAPQAPPVMPPPVPGLMMPPPPPHLQAPPMMPPPPLPPHLIHSSMLPPPPPRF